MKTNYQLLTDKVIENITAAPKRPSLLLHACCAPCSSYVLEYLSRYFNITLLYYNPNISPESEYVRRAREAVRLSEQMPLQTPVKVVCAEYEPGKFAAIAASRENMPEGGARCFDCYRLRLEYSAAYAKEHGYDYFTTTLSISPHKNAEVLNSIGTELARQYGIEYLLSDFKKKGGYLRSCQLSEQYGLYRQDYCGCEYSRLEAQKRKEKK